MWKRSPDRKAPARKTQKAIPKPVKKVILDEEPQYETNNLYEQNEPLDDEMTKQMEQVMLSEKIESSSVEENYDNQEQDQTNISEEYLDETPYTPQKEQIPPPKTPKPVKRVVAEVEEERPRTRGKEEDPNSLSKQAIIRLIKSSKVPSANSNVIDAIKEIIPTFSEKILNEICKEGEICTSDKVNQAISKYIKDEEKELNQEPFITAIQFDRLIRPILNERKNSFKRDAFYYFHLFIESMMVKFLVAADMIAEANRRQRIDAKDVSVAYMIFTM